jgi:hypothetical protein
VADVDGGADARGGPGAGVPVDIERAEDRDTYAAEELRSLRPLARIDLFEDERGYGGRPWFARRIAERQYQLGGRLILDFSDDVPPENLRNAAEAKLDFYNNVGAVLADLMDRAGSDDYLTETTWRRGCAGSASSTSNFTSRGGRPSPRPRRRATITGRSSS